MRDGTHRLSRYRDVLPLSGARQNFLQPETDPAFLARKRRRGEAHPWAKDPRRCAIRFLTMLVGGEGTDPIVHDMYDGPIPVRFRELFANPQTTLVAHNLDFDCHLLRRYGLTLSSRVFDTLLAARLLGLGLCRDSLEYLQGIEGLEHFEADHNPADNSLDTVVQRYLGVQIQAGIAKLGGSDWSRRNLSAQHHQCVRWDVTYLPALQTVLTRELVSARLWDCFDERMEFAIHLLNIKLTGIPIDREQCVRDREEVLKQKEAVREEIRELFSFYRPEVPKSRRKKIKRIKNEIGAVIMIAPPY
jgi:hypothetical protein